MDELSIRPYEPRDWPRLIAIHDAARKTELALAGLDGAFVPLELAAEREGLFDYTVRVACIKETVVGFVAYSDDELAWLYVDPTRTRRGIGKALILYALEHTAARPRLTEVLTGNEPARRLYEACGFRFVETASGQMPGNESFQVSAHVLRHD